MEQASQPQGLSSGHVPWRRSGQETLRAAGSLKLAAGESCGTVM